MDGEIGLLAYVLITVKSGSEREFLKEVSEFKEVIEANLVIGENDVVIKVKVKDIAQLDKFLTDKLRILPDVFLSTTMIITEQFKWSEPESELSKPGSKLKDRKLISQTAINRVILGREILSKFAD